MQGTFVIGSGTASGTGSATDTNGNVYKPLFFARIVAECSRKCPSLPPELSLGEQTVTYAIVQG
jgi:hypothetical protein